MAVSVLIVFRHPLLMEKSPQGIARFLNKVQFSNFNLLNLSILLYMVAVLPGQLDSL